jgi:hypothetical protein
MSDEDDTFLVCLPVSAAVVVVPGSTKTRCSACQQPVWISAASKALSQTRGLHILCMPCAEKRAADDDDVVIEPPTEEQRKEIRDTLERG